MTKDTKPAEAAPEELTLDEFCMRRSKADRRVELLGAFHADERSRGVIKDSEAAFLARLDKFATKPV